MNIIKLSATYAVFSSIFSVVGIAQAQMSAELLWIDMGETEFQLKISEYVDDQWNRETLIYTSDNPITSPALGTGPSGDKLVIWTEQIRSKTILKSMTRSVDGNWRLPTIFTDQGFENFSASIVYDLNGSAWVSWSSTLDELSDIYLVRSEGLNWSSPVRVNLKNEVPDIHPRLALTKTGYVEVRWSRFSFDDGSYIEDHVIFEDEPVVVNQQELNDAISSNDIQLPSFLPDNRLSVIHFPQNRMVQSALISSR